MRKVYFILSGIFGFLSIILCFENFMFYAYFLLFFKGYNSNLFYPLFVLFVMGFATGFFFALGAKAQKKSKNFDEEGF